jgi:hypothetical protein
MARCGVASCPGRVICLFWPETSRLKNGTPKPQKRKNYLKKQEKKKELLFVNKKKQKNFNNFWPVAFERPREAEQKFFGSFFQKRTPCFYLLF